MAAEPIVIYSHAVDPNGVLALLRGLAPDCKVTSSPAGWSNIELTARAGFFRKPLSLTFLHDPAYYAGPDFPNQMRGMQGYFSRFPASELTPRIMLLIASFRFSLTLFPPPEPELDLDSSDPRLKYIFAVAQHLDGVIFTPSSLRDAAGRFLYGANRQTDAQAVMPAIRKAAPPPSDLPRYAGGTAPNPTPPSVERIAHRALCLAAISWRGMLEREQDARENLERARRDFMEWVAAVGIKPELEPAELDLLTKPIGRGDPELFMNAEWAMEGAAVLAWALNQFELPAFDGQADVAVLGKALGLATPELARSFIERSSLRPIEEIETLSRQLVGLHWRFREQQLRPAHRDFEQKSQDAWYGKLPLHGVRFIKGDLAVGAYAINDAPAQIVGPCAVTLQERHRAVNWLCGASDVYSQTDTPT